MVSLRVDVPVAAVGASVAMRLGRGMKAGKLHGSPSLERLAKVPAKPRAHQEDPTTCGGQFPFCSPSPATT